MRRCNKELQLDLRSSSERFGFTTLEILRQFPLRYYLNIWLEIRTFLQGHEKCGLRGKGLLLTIKPSKFCCIFKNWVDLQCCFSNSSIWHNNQQPLWSLPHPLCHLLLCDTRAAGVLKEVPTSSRFNGKGTEQKGEDRFHRYCLFFSSILPAFS